MGPQNTKNSSLKCDFLIINYEEYCQNLVIIVKNTKFDQKTVSLLCVKTKSGARKQLTFYCQISKYFCRHLHSSLFFMGLMLTRQLSSTLVTTIIFKRGKMHWQNFESLSSARAAKP
jgi:hypothetical protein